MKVYFNLNKAIIGAWESVLNTGTKVVPENWQGVKSPQAMYEATDVGFKAIMPKTEDEAIEQIQPNLPWADLHFQERIGGKPLNPPPSHEVWPFNQEGNKKFIKDEKFDHTYPERFWPKFTEHESSGDYKNLKPLSGIRFEYGDYKDLIIKLAQDPETRQGWLPIWFPEDTGKPANIRVPCTLGYHFMIRGGRLDIKYIMRSTDMLRHFQDDIYLCWKLAYDTFQTLRIIEKVKGLHTLGYMTFLTFSGHIFDSEIKLLDKKITKWKNQ